MSVLGVTDPHNLFQFVATKVMRQAQKKKMSEIGVFNLDTFVGMTSSN
jgi:hypothetical protein